METDALTLSEARELFRYDPATGTMHRRHTTREKVGKAKANGYLVVMAKGRQYTVHRLAWFLTYGRWPERSIDHINRVKTDNRLCNLRDVAQAINARNRADGKKAQLIGPVRDGDRWMVVLPHYLATRTIGPFDTPEAAHEAFVGEQKFALMCEGRKEPKLHLRGS